MTPLPAPVTQADEYLYDIAVSLRMLTEFLVAQQSRDAARAAAAEERLLAPYPLREQRPHQHKGKQA